MAIDLTQILICPKTKKQLNYVANEKNNGNNACLVTKDNKQFYPVINSIPRFVSASNYADNFGLQWNSFAKTQLDSFSQTTISEDRFFSATGLNKDDLEGKWILDVGCGSGRFSEVALKYGANVVAIDYSSAVDACYENFNGNPRLHLVQCDICNLPFKDNFFDCIYCLGVLQHTPNVRKAFFSLVPKLKNNGQLVVDYYGKSFKRYLLPKYWLRPITKRIDSKKLFSILQVIVPYMLRVSNFIGRVPKIGMVLRRIIPVANYYDIYPLTKEQQETWALLDTFDWLAPQFDYPQSEKTVYKWMCEAGMFNIEVFSASHLVARGIKRNNETSD